MNKEIMLAMPVNQIASLCLTIAYYPDYDSENSDLIHAVENVVVNSFNIEQFLTEAAENYVFGLEVAEFENYEEFVDKCPTIASVLKAWSSDLCPKIIGAFYVDEMCKFQLVAEGLEVDKNIQWEVAKGWGR